MTWNSRLPSRHSCRTPSCRLADSGAVCLQMIVAYSSLHLCTAPRRVKAGARWTALGRRHSVNKEKTGGTRGSTRRASNGGGGGIRTLVPAKRVNGFRDRRIQPLCHPSVGYWLSKSGARRRHWTILAESLGFEPRIRFRRIHDFQSCSFGHSDNSPQNRGSKYTLLCPLV